MNSSLPILVADQLSFSYPNTSELILKNISFSLMPGESLGILGPNGGGKSTLMKIIAGLLISRSGKLTINNILISHNENYPHRFVGYIPQTSELNTILPITVFDYLNLAAKTFKIQNASERIHELLHTVDIGHKKHALLDQLSGGEKQRVLIARALLHSPRLLLLDEPMKGLDSNGQDQLQAILINIKNAQNTAIVIVDHNINQIIKSCDKIICLNKTSHWHNHSDLLTQNILENIYHCEFEHLLIHEKESIPNHAFCDNDHEKENEKNLPHKFLMRKKQ